MTPIIEDARRRQQQRRRRIVTIGAVGLAVIAVASVLSPRQFRGPSHPAGSTTLAKGATTTYTYGGMTIRGWRTVGQITLAPSMKVRNIGGGDVTALVVLNPTTGMVEVRSVNHP